MALPKLETPVYTLNLPSTDEEIKFRPFLVKEQKRIMMAQESDDVNETIDTINQLISDCTFNKIDTKKLAMFDAEYIFLQVRSKSVGSKVELNITCPDDKETKVAHTVDLDEINVAMFDDHTNEVQLTENIKVFFRYPLLSTFTKYASKTNTTDMMFKLIEECVEEVHYHDEVTNRVDMSEKDLSEFIDSLSTEQFAKMTKFFETMPRLRHKIEVKNPKTEITSEILLEGIQSFLV
tara:strand:+ start:1506 stop:2213 length:708 start_codon:yes stop_codon:yes gene_type:complete